MPETGKEVWSVQTTDTNTDMTITSAVRVVKGKVIVGTAGAEFGVRGFFSAYDAETGKLAWKFYTTPGANPETPELKKAAETWKGTDWSKHPRWRHGVGWHGVRSGSGPALHRHGQWVPLESPVPQSRRRRQPVSLLDSGGEAGHRKAGVVFPDDVPANRGTTLPFSRWFSRICASMARIGK